MGAQGVSRGKQRSTSLPLTRFTFPFPNHSHTHSHPVDCLFARYDTDPEPETSEKSLVSIAEMPFSSKWPDEGRMKTRRASTPGWDGRGVFNPCTFASFSFSYLFSLAPYQWMNGLASSVMQVQDSRLSDPPPHAPSPTCTCSCQDDQPLRTKHKLIQPRVHPWWIWASAAMWNRIGVNGQFWLSFTLTSFSFHVWSMKLPVMCQGDTVTAYNAMKV